MAQYLTVIDQYLRFLSIILPELGDELRCSLPHNGSTCDSLTSKQHIKAVESMIDVEYIEEHLRATFILAERIEHFLQFMSDRPDTQPIKLMIAEHGTFIGSTLKEFEHILKTRINIKIEYKELPGHILFEDYFNSSDGYMTKIHHVNDHKFHLAVGLHTWSYPGFKNLKMRFTKMSLIWKG